MTVTTHFVRHAPVINPENKIYGREIECDFSPSDAFDKARLELPDDNTLWISSDYPRALMTADLLKEAQQPIVVDPEFGEREMGDFVGRKSADVENDPVIKASYDKDPLTFKPPNGETFLDVVARVSRGLDRVIKQAADKGIGNIVIVSHAGVIRAAQYLQNGGGQKPSEAVPYLSVHKMQFRP